MGQWDEAHWQMVSRTIGAVCDELKVSPSDDQAGTILHGCRERGWHVEDIRRFVGGLVPPPPVTPPAPPRPGLGLVGTSHRQFTWPWRGMSAFKLGAVPRDEALRYLDFAADHGVTVLRLFGQVAWSGNAWSMEQTYQSLTTYLLKEAADRDIRLQVAMHCDTRNIQGGDLIWTANAQQWALLAQEHRNLIIEGANEPWTQTQDPRLLAWLRGQFPDIMAHHRVPMWCEGPAAMDSDLTDLTRGPFIVRHTERDVSENGWRWVRHTRELWDVAIDRGKPIVNSEPSRSDMEPTHHWALGVLCRLFGFGDTFHYGSGLHARTPDGYEIAVFLERTRGWTALPPGHPEHGYGLYYNIGHAESPVASSSNVLRAYTVHDGQHGYTLMLGQAVNGFLTWRPNWRPDTLDVRTDRLGYSAKLFEVTRV